MSHDGELLEVLRLGIDVGARVEQHGEAAEIRQDGGDRGTIDAGQHADDEHGDRERGAGVAGRHKGGGFSVAHEIGRHTERRVPLAPERLRRRLSHAHDLRGVPDLGGESVGLAAD